MTRNELGREPAAPGGAGSPRVAGRGVELLIDLVERDPESAEPGTRRLQSTVIDRGFEIPANAENHRVDASITLAQSAKLLSLTPHMHLRGKSWKFRAVFPDGTKKVLLSTPRYDFNWQMTHYLAEPMVLPAGTVIEGTAHYDNSAGNPHNPDPNSPVGWGDQSWEEMMVGFFDLELPADVDPEKVFGQPGGN